MVGTRIHGLIGGTWVRGTTGIVVRPVSEVPPGTPGSEIPEAQIRTTSYGLLVCVGSSGFTGGSRTPIPEIVVEKSGSDVRSRVHGSWMWVEVPYSKFRTESWPGQEYLSPRFGYGQQSP